MSNVERVWSEQICLKQLNTERMFINNLSMIMIDFYQDLYLIIREIVSFQITIYNIQSSISDNSQKIF